MDQLITSSTVWRAVDQIAAEARARTLSDDPSNYLNRREYGFVLDSKSGAILSRVQGDTKTVNFECAAHPIPGNVVVHSHPNATPLSPEDITIATGNGDNIGESIVFAVSIDGSLFWSGGWNKKKLRGPSDVASLWENIVAKWGKALADRLYSPSDIRMARIDPSFQPLSPEGITLDDILAFSLHHFWKDFAKRDLLTYGYRLTPEFEERYELVRNAAFRVGAPL